MLEVFSLLDVSFEYDFLSQLSHLRGVQRGFGSGGGRLDMVTVFTRILTIAGPLITVMGLWYYRHIVGFTILRASAKLVAPRSGRIVENYLVKKGVMLEVFFYSKGDEERKLCNARVKEVVGGKMVLQLINVSPTSLKLKNQRVICYVKPFAYSGRKINAFVTLVSSALKRGTVVKELSLYSPIRYRFVIRRRHKRQSIAREGAVRVKAWDGRKRKTFWMSKPEIQTINNPARYGNKTRISVENISPGGMRMLVVNPKGKLPPLGVGSQLVLRVSVFNPKTKKYSYFNVMGTVRSRFKGKKGSLGMGIQFTAEGEKIGSVYHWKSLEGEVESLANFLAKTR